MGVPKIGKFIEEESRMVVSRGQGHMKIKSYYLVSAELKWDKMKKSWRCTIAQ